jgi:hypothetical protein
MLVDNLKLLFRLYVRPRSTMAMIVDEGSFLFGVIAVAAITFLLTGTGALVSSAHEFAAIMEADGGMTTPGDEAGTPSPRAHDEAPPNRLLMALLAASGLWLQLGTFSVIAGLLLLYIPVLIFVMSLADRRTGSFSVALTRDYGSIGPCILISFAAAELLFGGVWLIVSLFLEGGSADELLVVFTAFAVVGVLGALYFIGLAWVAVRTVYGAGGWEALLAAMLPVFAMPLVGFLGMLASPFILYFLYLYVRSDITNIQWSMGARRAFKRNMEACTLNPRDAEAHLQLGLIHQHRRQYPEAIARFQRAIEIDPNEIDAHFQLGRIARDQGKHADAIKHFEVVVARDPKYGRHEIWREVGGTYFEAGDLVNARVMLERYVDKRPFDAEGLCLLGQTLKKLGDKEKAREVLQQCVDAAKTAPNYRRGELRRWRKRAEAEL